MKPNELKQPPPKKSNSLSDELGLSTLEEDVLGDVDWSIFDQWKHVEDFDDNGSGENSKDDKSDDSQEEESEDQTEPKIENNRIFIREKKDERIDILNLDGNDLDNDSELKTTIQRKGVGLSGPVKDQRFEPMEDVSEVKNQRMGGNNLARSRRAINIEENYDDLSEEQKRSKSKDLLQECMVSAKNNGSEDGFFVTKGGTLLEKTDAKPHEQCVGIFCIGKIESQHTKFFNLGKIRKIKPGKLKECINTAPTQKMGRELHKICALAASGDPQWFSDVANSLLEDELKSFRENTGFWREGNFDADFIGAYGGIVAERQLKKQGRLFMTALKESEGDLKKLVSGMVKGLLQFKIPDEIASLCLTAYRKVKEKLNGREDCEVEATKVVTGIVLLRIYSPRMATMISKFKSGKAKSLGTKGCVVLQRLANFKEIPELGDDAPRIQLVITEFVVTVIKQGEKENSNNENN